MQEKSKEDAVARPIIAIITAICLFILPYTKASDRLFFIVPLISEGLAYLILIYFSKRREREATKRTTGAKNKLLDTIQLKIESLKSEIDDSTDPKIKLVLEKELIELYKERKKESSKERDKLRGDIEKYEEEQEVCKNQSAYIRKNATEKLNDGLEKISNESR